MKILHVLDHSIPLQSGYTFRTRNILREQRCIGWETCHVTGLKQIGATALEEEVDGLHFYRTPDHGSFIENIPVINQLHVVRTLEKRIGEAIEEERPDILHAHSPALNGLAALRMGRRYDLPVVYECRAFWEDAAVDHGTSREGGLRYRMTRALETKVFREADAITTICDGLRADIIQRDVPKSKVTVIPNAVDIESFDRGAPQSEALRERMDLSGKTVLGFVGSFYAYEGLSLMLDALPSLLKEFPGLVFLLVGGGPQEQALINKIHDLKIGSSVICTGRVPHEEVSSYYDLVDILVYPRLPMRLTELVTPLKPLEAMAQRKLIVASDVGGHRELIEEGKTGCLFKAGDVTSLKNAIASLLQNRNRWGEIINSGRKFVEEYRNWPVSVARYKKVYHDVM